MSRHSLLYLQKQREAEHAKLQKTIDKLRTEEEPVKPINKKFSSTTDGFEDILKEQTVGLSSLAEYTLKREQVEEQLQANDVPLKKTKKRKMEVDRGDEEGGDDEERKKPRIEKAKLSFAHEDEEEEDGAAPVIIKKIVKNPNVDTSFLPDKERDEAIHREKLLQKQLWLDRQEKIKAENIKIDFNFFDGTTHPSHCTVKKSQSVREVLESARRTFDELRKLSSDKLMLVKDNLIIPAYLTFYELTESYAGEDKNTTLAYWDSESAVKKSFHIPRVMVRQLYEKNKHIYPYTLYEEFDEFKQKEWMEELSTKAKEKQNKPQQ